MGPLETRLRDKLAGLNLAHVEVENESGRHSRGEAESHFKLTLVGGAFAGLSRIERHRLVNDLLADELREGIHALSLRTSTEDEWRAQGGATYRSPGCGSRGIE